MQSHCFMGMWGLRWPFAKLWDIFINYTMGTVVWQGLPKYDLAQMLYFSTYLCQKIDNSDLLNLIILIYKKKNPYSAKSVPIILLKKMPLCLYSWLLYHLELFRKSAFNTNKVNYESQGSKGEPRICEIEGRVQRLPWCLKVWEPIWNFYISA